MGRDKNEQDLPLTLIHLLHLASLYKDKVLNEQGKDFNVTAAQLKVLASLYKGVCDTPIGLAETLDMDTGGVARMLARLVAKGLVARKVDSSDRRRAKLWLTPEGITVCQQIIDNKQTPGINERLTQQLTPNEVSQLKSLLTRLLPADYLASRMKNRKGNS
ncbi:MULTISPECIES: MarR family transcriptional regulator [unclassified Brenneria]|uniref:MarR family transcriptional regulator n=1 Tax=unclassified Brenneria TaxID=2634434 RepID=UPI0029C5544B|nr:MULTISPECIES: MarR family transcriptional regulator [unclassified Brenneria]MDX5627454.1 MarR family transcriptional regulator [Brenneria sp. L3-3Z]MDX5694390.1 MarR family transcriptional regulator [Brenneria sp. L4-2C]MEE3661987.1 MarR family transcriptional regulator [Brenneria sp. g21c3]